MERVDRPLWRGFKDERRAARHARRGGIAVVDGRVFGAIERPLFVDWMIRALEDPRVQARPELGVLQARIPDGWIDRVGEWLARDSRLTGATHPLRFDCTRCAACCVDNVVLLDAQDRARFREAGLPVRHTLPLLPGPERACVYLQGFRCGIYPQRPNMCREFPPGTEQCLFSREEVFGTPFPAGR